MKKSVSLLAVAMLVGATAPVFAADAPSTSSNIKVESDANNYDKKTTTQSTDASGTTTENKNELKIKRDDNGNYKKTVTNQNSTNPGGWFNKSTAKTTSTEEKNADGSANTEYKKQINGKTVEDDKTQTN
jgi:hypothetical protein